MKKNEENEEKCEISEDFSGFWLHTQNPRRCPRFVVVVVTFFNEIIDVFRVFQECVFFPKKICLGDVSPFVSFGLISSCVTCAVGELPTASSLSGARVYCGN